MKISKVVYKSEEELKKVKPFNMKIKPQKQSFYLRPLTWLLSFSEIKKCNLKINRINMEGIEPPYLILCNHNSFIDFKVLTKAIYPHPANYIVAIDGFINREWLLRRVGCICKRKFLTETRTVKNIKYSLEKNKYICAIYPEARYSHIGTNAILPSSLGKLVKLLKCQVVTLICHGNHLRQPVWNLGYKRNVDITADMKCIVRNEEIESLSVDEINKRINDEFTYDDYKYQLENNIEIKEDTRALGLDRILYKCPHCNSEEHMRSTGTTICCDKCMTEYELTALGMLRCINNEGIFTTINDWYEWERKCVRDEIESGNYKIEVNVNVDDLKSSKGFYRIGQGVLTHSYDGVKVKIENDERAFEFSKSPMENYSAHVEYAYFGRGDAISFSFENDSYYMFPIDNKNIVTKLHFAIEELYKYTKKNKVLGENL